MGIQNSSDCCVTVGRATTPFPDPCSRLWATRCPRGVFLFARLRVLVWGPAPQDSHSRILSENVSSCFLRAKHLILTSSAQGEVSPFIFRVVKAFVLYPPPILSICWALLVFSHTVVSDSLQHLGLQHTRPPSPSPSPGVYPSSYSLHR